MKGNLYYIMDEFSDPYGGKFLARVGKMSKNLQGLIKKADQGGKYAHVLQVGNAKPVYHKLYNL